MLGLVAVLFRWKSPNFQSGERDTVSTAAGWFVIEWAARSQKFDNQELKNFEKS